MARRPGPTCVPDNAAFSLLKLGFNDRSRTMPPPMFRLLSVLLLLLPIATVSAEQRFEGELADAKGRFSIELPAGWQPGDRLIIFNRGLTMQQPAQLAFPRTAPNVQAREYWLEQGYGLAAGSYSSRGWALLDIEREQRALLAEFRRRAGEPGEILIVGGSLGGLVSLRTAEAFFAEGVEVAGVYSLCPALAGARTWDAALDIRLLFDAVCPDDRLPSGSQHLRWVIDYAMIPDSINDPEQIDEIIAQIAMGEIAVKIARCTGLFLPSWWLPSPGQLARRARLKELIGIETDHFLRTNLAYAIYVAADLIQAPEKLAGHNPLDNTEVDYGDADINARILRVERDPLAAVKLRAQSDPTGRIGNARVLALHTERDELLVPEHLQVLQQLDLPERQLAMALVGEEAPAHCKFSPAEFRAGFDGLRRWIDHDEKPDPARLDALCAQARGDLGQDQRCAFQSTEAIGDLDARIRPRGLELEPVTRHHSGAWFDPDYDGEGAIIEILDGGQHAVVSWYSYPASSEAGEQTWIIGLGRISEDGIHVGEARQYHGARFGQHAFDPDDVEERIWGEFTFWFDGCGSGEEHPGGLGVGRLRFAGPPEYGSGERRLLQLTGNVATPQLCPGAPPASQPHPQSRYSGSWFRGPEAPGEGLQLQVGGDGRAIAIWYSYDPQGRPAWMIGSAMLAADTDSWVIPLQRPRGTRFGNAFDPAQVQRPDWGELRITFTGCDTAQLRWTSSEPGWSDGEIALARLTRPAGLPACG
jgi:hypothetical protein